MAAEELQASESPNPSRRHPKKKRKLKNGKSKKHQKISAERTPGSTASKKQKKPTKKMLKLFRKRTRDYESHSEDDAEEAALEKEEALDSKPVDSSDDDEERDLDAMDEFGSSDEEIDGDGVGIGARHQGITKFTEGCRAFRAAFKKIMKKHLPDDLLGPILSAHKKLVAEKLAEEVVEKKAKGEAKKEKDLAGEKGHVKPSSLLDAKDKQLISIATKGVVKLFNAVNKAQNPLKGLNPSRSKDAKVLAKRRKQTFLSELQKPTSDALDNSSLHNPSNFASANGEGSNEPGWAPLRDSYMLTSSRLKDWDKMADPASVIDSGIAPVASSSDEE